MKDDHKSPTVDEKPIKALPRVEAKGDHKSPSVAVKLLQIPVAESRNDEPQRRTGPNDLQRSKGHGSQERRAERHGDPSNPCLVDDHRPSRVVRQEELERDVYDCAYLALAHQEAATSIVTTDTDFKELCERLGLRYVNPVPEAILRKFGAWKLPPQSHGNGIK